MFFKSLNSANVLIRFKPSILGNLFVCNKKEDQGPLARFPNRLQM